MATTRPPEPLRKALARARAGDAEALLRAVIELEEGRAGLGWSWLCHLSSVETAPSLLRTLAFAIATAARTSRLTSYSQAAWLWAMHECCSDATASDERSQDVSTVSNLLVAVEEVFRGGGSVPRALRSSMLSLLRCGLDHPEPVVRHNVLDALVAARGHLDEVVNRAAAADLATRLQRAVGASVEDDENEALSSVLQSLRGTDLPAVAPSDSRGLQRVLLDLEDALDELGDDAPDMDDLVQTVRHRAMLDGAIEEAISAEAPVQTVRLEGPQASTRLVDALWRFGESVVRMTTPSEQRTSDDEDAAGLGFGVEVRPALAASFPVQLIYDDEAAEAVFDALTRVYALLDLPEDADAELGKLAAPVVEAAWRLIEHAATFEGTIEVVLTDPTRAEWQRTLSGDFSKIAQIARRALPARARLGYRDTIVLDRTDVPQANTVKQVFECVDAMARNGEVNVADISSITAPRQVDYYKHGARVLGLFDDDNLPTARARAILGLPYPEQLGVTAVYFEDSAIGRAWRRWAGEARLSDVDPKTAESFLTQCARGLSGTTPARRASTLRKWHAELMPMHYANRPKSPQRRSSKT